MHSSILSLVEAPLPWPAVDLGRAPENKAIVFSLLCSCSRFSNNAAMRATAKYFSRCFWRFVASFCPLEGLPLLVDDLAEATGLRCVLDAVDLEEATGLRFVFDDVAPRGLSEPTGRTATFRSSKAGADCD